MMTYGPGVGLNKCDSFLHMETKSAKLVLESRVFLLYSCILFVQALVQIKKNKACVVFSSLF